MVEIKLIHGDCLEEMKKMKDNSVDLVVTSPPYNMGGKSLGYKPLSKISNKHYNSYNDNLPEKKYIIWCRSVIRECLRISRYVMWNVQPLVSTRNHIVDIQTTFKKNLKDYFIWHKQPISSINSKKGALAKGFEFVFMLGKDNTTLFKYNNFPKNNYIPNIKTWYKKESFKEHSATFPKELPMYFIEHFTKENDLVLDCFMGTGTTGVACKLLNRNFIGIEIDKKYIDIARKRINSIPNNLF